MQGDPKVDELMRPVLAAIKRHVKNSDAITDIYNRAYEAVMNSMDVKTGKTYCAYCGAEYPLDDSAATLVSEHIKTCEKHPMRAAEAEVARLTAELSDAHSELSDLRWKIDDVGMDMAFHPRAAKLMRKRKPFVVVAFDEPYYMDAYDLIRDSEMQKGTWTVEDQWHYDDAKAAHRARVGGAS